MEDGKPQDQQERGILAVIDRWADRTAREIFSFGDDLPGKLWPQWNGPIHNKRWRLVMAWKALRGYELGGFGQQFTDEDFKAHEEARKVRV
jgi:hypothetical protein